MLIAEIGNNHLGRIEKFKELILAARDAGATVVKSQAFVAEDLKGVSLPLAFYQQCQFSLDEYVELIWWSRETAQIELFFSIFSRSLNPILKHQQYFKIAGSQSGLGFFDTESLDSDHTFVSIREGAKKPTLLLSKILHVSGYLSEAPALENIELLSECYQRRAGYSDHTLGLDACKRAVEDYKADVIEKHFTLTRDLYWEGVQYRDAIHSADKKQLLELSKFMEAFK